MIIKGKFNGQKKNRKKAQSDFYHYRGKHPYGITETPFITIIVTVTVVVITIIIIIPTNNFLGGKKNHQKKSQKSWKKSWGEKKSESKKNVIKKFKKKWG